MPGHRRATGFIDSCANCRHFRDPECSGRGLCFHPYGPKRAPWTWDNDTCRFQVQRTDAATSSRIADAIGRVELRVVPS